MAPVGAKLATRARMWQPPPPPPGGGGGTALRPLCHMVDDQVRPVHKDHVLWTKVRRGDGSCAPRLIPPPSPPRRPPEGTLGHCTCAQGGRQAQNGNWLVSGLQDHRYRSVTRQRHEDARGQSTERTKGEAMQRTVVTTAQRQHPDLTAHYTH